MKRALVLSVCAGGLLWAAPMRAELILTVPSATFNTTDGTDTLDVIVTGDGMTSFGAFTLSFAITPDASNAMAPFESLQFNSSGDAALGPTLPLSAGYVFYGNSLDVVTASPFVSALSPDNTQLTLADSTADFSDVTRGGGATALLAQLIFAVPTNVTNSGGDKFDVTLTSDPASSLQSNNSGDVALDPSSVLLGIVTVESPMTSPVPEPGTFGMVTGGMMGLAWLKRRRRMAH